MPVRDEEKGCFQNWRKLIKDDNISEVLTEAGERSIGGENALQCMIYISQLAYKDTQDEAPFRSPPEDIVQLTEVLCSSVTSQPLLCNLRFITSLYHVAYFFFKRDHLLYVKRVFKIILKAKETNISTFQGSGRMIYDHFILLLKKFIPKVVSNEDGSDVKESFSILLDMLIIENVIESGSTFLGTVLYTSQIVASQNKKLAGILICKGLQLFSEVEEIKDIEMSLSLVFKLYLSLFHHQLELTGYDSALGVTLSFVDTQKLKFCKGSMFPEHCFSLLCKAEMFTSSSSKMPLNEMIQSANMILEKFQKIKWKEDFVKEACLLMVCFVSSLDESKAISSSEFLGVYLQPFLEMMLNLFSVLRDFNMDKFYYIQCLSICFMIMTKEKKEKKQVLKECLNLILRTVKYLLEVNQTLRSENHAKADWCTKLVLTRCANLIHIYHLESLNEEIIVISKPICKFICTLPSYIFNDAQNKISVNLAFTCLIRALGPQQLYEVLEVAVVWLLVCPQSSEKVFQIWGVLKHNAICAGLSNFLDTTILTIVTEGKSSLEKNWLTFNLTKAEIGNLLVKELNTYFANSTLRSSPVLQASKALESLDITDVLTQVRGVVVALDVTSARSEYTEQCHHFYSRSQQLLASLCKQKNHYDPVDFNCSMGELLYAQFRFKLNSFRSACECEVLRLSAISQPAKPLVAELPENRPDPDDTCDVTTRYANLSLAKQQEILADLNTAVAHWRVACTLLTKNVELGSTKYDLRISLENLQEAACLMNLYCDEVKERELWQLVYNMALLTDDQDKVVIAVGEMLKGKDIDQAAVDKAENLLNQRELPTKIKHIFLFKKALFHLTRNEIAEGIKLLKVGVEAKKSLDNSIYINFLITLGKYQKLSHWMMHNEPFSFSPSCHFSFHKAVSYLLYDCQQRKWNSLIEASYIQLHLLQVSHELGQINWILEQPREARCYLKSQLFLAQKLGLPLRTVQLLLVLAWVDLNTGMMDDCQVKIEGLEALLNLQGTLAKAYTGEPDSPKGLSKAVVQAPEFLEHCAGCDCFVCHCIKYQQLVLETLTLRATFCVNNEQLAPALQSFKVAMQVQKHLSWSDDVEVQASCARMWKHYADTLVLSKKPKDTKNVNKKALDALPTSREPNTVLQHILYQRSCLHNQTSGRTKPIRCRIFIEVEENQPSTKTPGKGCGAAPVSEKTPLSVQNINITPKFARPVRKLAFPSSGEENTPPPTSKSRRKVKPPPKFTIKSPQTVKKLQKIAKTPFKIVDDDGHVVSISSSKVCSGVKKYTEVKADPIVEPKINKTFGPDKKSQNSGIFRSPIRKSNRNPKVRTYEKNKNTKNNILMETSKIPSTSQSTNKTEIKTGSESEMFRFDALELEVNKIRSIIPKPINSKSSSLVTNKQVCANSEQIEADGSDVFDSDCSVVEGTPKEKNHTKPKA